MTDNPKQQAHRLVEEIFGQILPQSGLAVRREQIALCHAMLDSFLEGSIALCDAGVGIGKTYAYLVACILFQNYMQEHRKNRKPAVISTSSVALQEAILKEYIPFLSRILLENEIISVPLRACIRKGKERFVCDARLSVRLRTVSEKKKNAAQMTALRSLLQHCDMDEVYGLSGFDRQQVCVPKVCPKNCLKRDICRYHKYLKTVQSESLDIQICNHNYLLADAEHCRQELRPLLQSYSAVIVDEAHKLCQAASQMYEKHLYPEDYETLCILLEKEKCIRTAQELRAGFEQLLRSIRREEKRGGDQRLPFVLTAQRTTTLKKCQNFLRQLAGSLPRGLLDRLGEAEQTVSLFLERDQRYVRMIQYDRKGVPGLCAASREIPHQLRRALWQREIPAVLTSGTLMAGNSFARTKQMMGLAGIRKTGDFAAPSPFCYEQNCLLYVPRIIQKIPRGSKAEIAYLARQIGDLVEATCGHTLVLFTSYSLMGAVYALARNTLGFPLLEVWRNSQDTVRRFKQSKNAVLFAAGSCWEGMDFPGDMVSSLIISRLPFPVPDPVSEAERSNYMTLQAYIQGVVVPEMQVKLRQGFGRAIRTETDTCVVSILDPRAAPEGKYHREVMDSLPAVPLTREIKDIEEFIGTKKGPDYFLP
ncbi:MAG TPA: ATP-dependent DNA helicase [Candidatus Anaerofilum faecale]|nr:ATP-dependent DNA helicase [Candidatus Anaerofilum faecale]